MVQKNSVWIAFATDEKFYKYTMVAIESVIEHANPVRQYHIGIMHHNLPEKLQRELENLAPKTQLYGVKFAAPSQVQIRCIEMENIRTREELPVMEQFPVGVYDRYYLGKVFPQAEKVLYLDSDLVALCDVAELYDSSLDGHCLGACVSCFTPFMNGYARKKLGLLPEYYFNSGVLLIDTKRFEQSAIREKCFHILQNAHFLCPDQDALNLACRLNANCGATNRGGTSSPGTKRGEANHQGTNNQDVNRHNINKQDIAWLPDEWNYQWSHDLTGVNSWADKPNRKHRERMLEARKQCKILHYASNYKPWNGSYSDLVGHFWTYAANTPVYESLRMQLDENSKKPVPTSGLSRAECSMIYHYCGLNFLVKKTVLVRVERICKRKRTNKSRQK